MHRFKSETVNNNIYNKIDQYNVKDNLSNVKF